MYKDVIGIIGGMGSYATVEFFKNLLDSFPAEKEWDRPHIIVDNYCTMPSRVRAILYNEQVEELKKQLSNAVENLQKYSKDNRLFVILACNTSHYFLPYLKHKYSSVNFIDIIECCAKDMFKRNIKSVLVVASEGTIETRLYDKYFINYDIEVSYPYDAQESIRHYIEAVKQNNLDGEVLNSFNKFIENLNCNNIILGCTELPVIYNRAREVGNISNKIIINPLKSAITELKNYIR